MRKTKNTVVFGASGLVGSAIIKQLNTKIDVNVHAPTSSEVNLLNYDEVVGYLKRNDIEEVYFCAAKVGGIQANKEQPVEFFNVNMQLGMNVVRSAYETGVKKLMNLGSTCIYPRVCPQPMKEEHLLCGPVETTNEGYALAKISILKLCEFYNREYGANFMSVMPTNVYGPNDNYHPKNAHAVPSMIRKIHEAKLRGEKEIVCWGDGTPVREFIYSEDLAEGIVFAMDNCSADQGFFNIGTGKGETIANLYRTVMNVLGFEGELVFDLEKPNGNPLKTCDTSKINSLGWASKVSLEDGIMRTYEYLKSHNFQWKEK